MRLFGNRRRVALNIDLNKQILTDISPSERKPGVRVNTANLHSKQPSGIAVRLRQAGIDWIVSFGAAIKANDKELLSLWLRLLPYLIVTKGHQRVKKFKGHASKAALAALNELEGSPNSFQGK
jgi:hypothetical protein